MTSARARRFLLPLAFLVLGGRGEGGGPRALPWRRAVLGLTRVLPDGLGADERLTVALGLGMRWPLTRHLGARADARGYHAIVSSGGGSACIDGSCLLVFGSSGVWHGDLTAALVWTF